MFIDLRTVLMPVQFNQFIIRFRKLESKLDFLGCSENLRLVMQKKRKKNRKQNYSRVKVELQPFTAKLANK